MIGPPPLTRRGFIALSGSALAAGALPGRGLANIPTGTALHGLSAFGELKYPPDFTHFDYASPGAPKGGTFNFSPPSWAYNQNILTFNTLNTFVRGGDAPPRMEMCFDSLMVRAIDEPDAIYGLLAESVTVSDDANTLTFRMRPEARFHDDTPLTAEDVAFTYTLFKESGHPSLLLPLSEMEEAVADDDHTLRLVFSGNQSARTILSVAQYPVVSKAYFDEHPFDSSQLDAPLGSGPYRVGRFSSGQTIVYERVSDYWGRDLPVNRGFFHFDRIRIDFFRDRSAAFEAFKKGDVNYRQEFTSRIWATGYDFPAFEDGKVVKRGFPSELTPAMQAWAINQRHARFRDPRVRRAIALCFDFEWTNRNLFYDAYERSHSTFERSEYKAEGEPSAQERELLERFRDDIPQEAFGEAVMQPVSNGSGRDRALLQKASDLLSQAGWAQEDGSPLLTNGDGEELTLEMLARDETFVRVFSPFVDNMRAIGIDASVRLIDAAQFQRRLNEFDFDMVGIASSFSATPTREELERVFHSRAAGVSGTRNLPGTENRAVDGLIEAAGRAGDRDELTAILRALDRVLRARGDWIPNWHASEHRVAYWDMFGFTEPKPDFGFPVEAMWWHDEDKAKEIDTD